MRAALLDSLEGTPDAEDGFILDRIDELIMGRYRNELPVLEDREATRRELFNSVRRLDILQDLVDDESITEIMVNDWENIFIEKDGKITRYGKTFTGRERLNDIIQIIAGRCNRVVNEQNPVADARLENGDRVNIVLPPVSLSGPVLTIRRFPKHAITMKQLIRWGSITKEAAAFLESLVKAGYSILVGGGTSTGKTTFLNALSNYIPSGERIVTIEDNAELQIQGVENLVRLEARNAGFEENREITIRDLIKTALRMRPSRIIIGEVRGSEAGDFLTCLNTGHSGSLGSAHANSARDMIGRLEMMVRMGMDLPIPVIRSQIASGVDIIVHLYRDSEGKRKVEEIMELTGFDGNDVTMHRLFGLDRENRLVQTGELINKEKRERLIASKKITG